MFLLALLVLTGSAMSLSMFPIDTELGDSSIAGSGSLERTDAYNSKSLCFGVSGMENVTAVFFFDAEEIAGRTATEASIQVYLHRTITATTGAPRCCSGSACPVDVWVGATFSDGLTGVGGIFSRMAYVSPLGPASSAVSSFEDAVQHTNFSFPDVADQVTDVLQHPTVVDSGAMLTIAFLPSLPETGCWRCWAAMESGYASPLLNLVLTDLPTPAPTAVTSATATTTTTTTAAATTSSATSYVPGPMLSGGTVAEPADSAQLADDDDSGNGGSSSSGAVVAVVGTVLSVVCVGAIVGGFAWQRRSGRRPTSTTGSLTLAAPRLSSSAPAATGSSSVSRSRASSTRSGRHGSAGRPPPQSEYEHLPTVSASTTRAGGQDRSTANGYSDLTLVEPQSNSQYDSVSSGSSAAYDQVASALRA